MKLDLHPYRFTRRLGECAYEKNGHPCSASYIVLDKEEEERLETLGQKQEMGAQPGMREIHEMTLQVMKWRRSGQNVIIVGPETTKVIKQRLKNNDIPTAPVPPAYIEFTDPFLNYGASLKLVGAYLYRGRLGRITFLNGPQDYTSNYRTVYLPGVFRDKNLEFLKSRMTAEKIIVHSDLVKQMARDVLQYDPTIHSLDDLRIAENHIGSLKSHTDYLMENSENGFPDRAEMLGYKESPEEKADRDYFIDVSMIKYNNILGRPLDVPSPLQPKAARAVLIAADEARKFDPVYAAPEYINSNPTIRNHMEEDKYIVEKREEPVILP